MKKKGPAAWTSTYERPKKKKRQKQEKNNNNDNNEKRKMIVKRKKTKLRAFLIDTFPHKETKIVKEDLSWWITNAYSKESLGIEKNLPFFMPNLPFPAIGSNRKKQILTYPDKIHNRGNHTIDRDSTQCSVFSVLEKSTTTDTMLHQRNELCKRNLH